MLRSHAERLHSLILALDHIVSGAICLAIFSLPGMMLPVGTGLPFRALAVALVATFVWPFLFEQLGLYGSQRRVGLVDVARRLLLAGAIATAVVAGFSYAISAPLAPAFPILCSAAQLATLGALRIAILLGLRFARRQGRNYRNVLIVGSGPRARNAAALIEQNPVWGLRILGFADESGDPVDPALADRPIFKLSDVQTLFRDEVVDEVVVACPRAMLPAIEPVAAACASVGVPMTLFSDLFGDYLPSPRSGRFGGMPALSFAMVHHSPVKLAVKRGIDVAGSAALLLVVAPVIALAALAIKLTSPGPVLFRQVRCGLYGRRFDMIKLRTMYVDAEQRKQDLMHLNEASGPVFKMRNDPRITPVGRWLRRWSIDEVPQLWNVLRGNMSLVGPRPPIPAEVALYEIAERRRLSMRPGLTCLWQVKGRSSIGFEEWVRLDLEYIDRWSLLRDLKILVQTIPAVLRGTGAS